MFYQINLSVLVKKLTRKSISEMTYFVSSGMYKNSSGDESDEIANVNFYAVRPEATRIRWNNAVQGHSRSPILVPIESSYTSSY